MRRVVKNLRHSTCMFLAEVLQDNALLSCFSFHIVNKYPFHSQFSAIFFAFLCFLLVISMFKMTPKHSVEVLSNVRRARRLWCAFCRKCVLSGMRYSAVDHEFNANSSTIYILNKVSSNRNTHKTKLCIYRLMKMLWPEQWFRIL